MTLGGVHATTQQTQERQTAVCGCAISHQCAKEWMRELCFTSRRISLSVIDFYINFCPTLFSWKLCEPWRSVYGFQRQITKECGRSLVMKIQVMNVENNSVNEILFGRHLTLRSLLSQPLVLQNIACMGNALIRAKFICSSSHSCTLYPGWSFYLSSMISPEIENTGSRKATKQTRQYSQQTV